MTGLKRLLPIPFLAMIWNIAYAQDSFLFGKIKDHKTLEPLVGATISIEGGTGISTDMDGNFKIKLAPGSYKLTFSYLGYESLTETITLADNALEELNIRLKYKSKELEVIVITSSQYEKNIAEETVSMDVIGKDLIKNTNSRDLGEAVNKTPGVQVADGQITIRSGSGYSYGVGSRTAVMVDNLSMMSSDLGEAQLKFTPVENVEQIEIIKGASSVVYGSSALNGVVNVRTAWPKSGEKATDINFYYGIYDNPKREELKWWSGYQPNFSGMFLNHKQRFGNLQFVGGGNIDYIQSYLEQANEFRIRGNFKTKYVLPKNSKISFGLNANIMKENSGRFFISQDLDSNAYRYSQGSKDNYIRTNVDPHFTYQDDNGHRFTLQSRYLNVFRNAEGRGINASSNNFTIDPQYQKNWSNRFIITTGLPVTIGTSRSNLYKNRRRNYTGAAYAQGEFKHKDLSLVAGVRYEISAVDSIFDNTTPVFRSGLNYKLGKASFLRASYGQSYRIPSIGERYIDQEFFEGVWVVPNPALKIERGWSAEVGLKQGLKLGNWRGFFDFSVYWQEYENFVEYRFTFYPGPRGTIDANGNIYNNEGALLVSTLDTGKLFFVGLNPINVKKAKVLGYEASIMGEGEIGPIGIRTLMGYTYAYPGNLEQDSTITTGQFIKDAFHYMFNRLDPEETYKISQFRSRHIIRGDIEFSYKKWALGYSIYYNSFPESIPFEFTTAISLLAGSDESLIKYLDKHEKGDWVMDLRASYQLSPKVKGSFIVKNLTNHEYAARPGKLEPPRHFTLQFNVKI